MFFQQENVLGWQGTIYFVKENVAYGKFETKPRIVKLRFLMRLHSSFFYKNILNRAWLHVLNNYRF